VKNVAGDEAICESVEHAEIAGLSVEQLDPPEAPYATT